MVWVFKYLFIFIIGNYIFFANFDYILDDFISDLRDHNKEVKRKRVKLDIKYRNSFDPVLDQYYRELLNKNFNFESKNSTYDIAKIISEDSGLKTLLEGRNYDNLYYLLLELHISGHMSYEAHIINNAIIPKIKENNFDSYYLTKLMYYFDTIYLKPILIFIENYQYGRAKKLISRLLDFVKKLDSPPLNKLDQYTLERINKLLLLEIALSNSLHAFIDVNFFNEVIKMINYNLDPYYFSKTINIANKITKSRSFEGSDYADFLKYIIGVLHFREKNYETALVYLKQISNKKGNVHLHQLSNLMTARIYFWKFESIFYGIESHNKYELVFDIEPTMRKIEKLKILRNKTKKILSEIHYKNYKNDVYIYMEQMEEKISMSTSYE